VKFLVVKAVTSTELDAALEILNALKTVNPGCAVYAMTSLADSADYTTWLTAATLAKTNFGTLLTGLFIDKFSIGSTAGTRVNQNLAVTFCHSNNLQAFVAGGNILSILEPYAGLADPVIGRSPSIKDYVLLDNFFLVNGVGDPVPEALGARAGRLDYVNAARIDRLASTPAPLNIGFAAQVGAGTSPSVDATRYKEALKLANDHAIEMFAVAPNDHGATTHRYFLNNQSNTLV
jgi:hypothetical protein